MAYNNDYSTDEFGETINNFGLEDYGDDDLLAEDRLSSMDQPLRVSQTSAMDDDEFHETLHSGHIEDQLGDPTLAAEVENDYRLNERVEPISPEETDSKTAS
jgi:hypothetical protein